MKVAIHASLDSGTGVARYTRNLLTQFAQGVDDIHAKVFTYPSRPARPDWLPSSVEYRRSRIPGRVQNALIEKLRVPTKRLFSLSDCDLVHMTNLMRFRSRLPCVVTVYDVAWRNFGRDYYPVFPKNLVRQVEELIHSADHLLAISRFTADELVRGGISANRVTVTPLGVDERFRVVSSEQAKLARCRYKLPEQFVLYVGAINVRKNVTTLAQAMSMVYKHIDVGLVLVGPHPIEGLAAWGLDHPWVQHLGFVPENDLPGIYAAAATVVVPAKLEGFGLPVVEAMAAGVPVVASDIEVFKEIGEDALFYFSPDDHVSLCNILLDVLQHQDVASEKRAASRIRSAQFSWEACAKATAAAYNLTLRNFRGAGKQ